MSALIFAPPGDAHRLGRAMGAPVLFPGLSKAEVTDIITGMHNGTHSAVIATREFVHGWSASKDTQVFFLDGFPDDHAMRVQAEARVRRL